MFLGKRATNIGQRGDTIVEVLIAIAVVSVILGGAFVTTNRSLVATRGSEERSNAVKLTESQLELLKGLVATDADTINNAPASFCITSATTVAASTSAACTVNSTGAPTTADPKFNLAITRSGDVFNVRTEWQSLQRANKDNVEMIYRIYD